MKRLLICIVYVQKSGGEVTLVLVLRTSVVLTVLGEDWLYDSFLY